MNCFRIPVRWTPICLVPFLMATATALADDPAKPSVFALGKPDADAAFRYPYQIGQLSFPTDEGKHPPLAWPVTLAEWYAHYIHLTADDGNRYFLFATFVAFDPLEKLLGGKFPHAITTLVDVDRAKTYHHRDMAPLKNFSSGHVDVQTTAGDRFLWKGDKRPFEYDLHLARRDAAIDYSLDLEMKMVKPVLAVNGSGYIKLVHGDSGYYSQTRLEDKGRLTINGVTKRVSGIQWIDRQWLGATCARNGSRHSYDWWALQLDNQEEAILFRIWNMKTNSVVMWWLDINRADGTREHVEKFTLTEQPSGWHLSAPAAGWELKILPACKDQGIWQSCNISGTIHGKPIRGLAAAELAKNILDEFPALGQVASPE